MSSQLLRWTSRVGRFSVTVCWTTVDSAVLPHDDFPALKKQTKNFHFLSSNSNILWQTGLSLAAKINANTLSVFLRGIFIIIYNFWWYSHYWAAPECFYGSVGFCFHQEVLLRFFFFLFSLLIMVPPVFIFWFLRVVFQGLMPQTLSVDVNIVTLSDLTPRTRYCVKVQSCYDFYNKTSRFTSPLCTYTQGNAPLRTDLFEWEGTSTEWAV